MYTISTNVASDADFARNVVTRIEGSLAEVWEAHANEVKTYAEITSTEKVKEEKHPLEGVFERCMPEGALLGLAAPKVFNPDDMFDTCMRLACEGLFDTATIYGVRACVLATCRRVGVIAPYALVLSAAVEQATKGKGQRHGGDKTPFLEQPWVRLHKNHGLGFLLGQADKKYHEACGKENKEDAEREFLGAIVYLGMALLVLEGKVK